MHRLSSEGAKEGRKLRTSIVLRPHHLLCVQGFRGLGYSPQFVATMQRVVATLQDNAVLVRVEVRADVICQSCPYLTDSHICSRGTPADRDQAVLSVLKVRPGVDMDSPEPTSDRARPYQRERIHFRLVPTSYPTLALTLPWVQAPGYYLAQPTGFRTFPADPARPHPGPATLPAPPAARAKHENLVSNRLAPANMHQSPSPRTSHR